MSMKKMMSLLLVGALAACHPPKSGETLVDSIRAYNEGVRWERFANAAVHVPPKERSQFVDDADQRAKDLRITDYEVVRVDKQGDRRAVVHVKISWYLDSEGTLRETQARQQWERQGKNWYMVDEARIRGKEMPGLRDAPDAAVKTAATGEQAAPAPVVREAPNQQ